MFSYGKIEKMKIAIVAGGTGGHIYPAITLAEELIVKGHDITFIGSNDRMEKDVIPSRGYKYIGLNVYTTRGSIFQKVKSLLSIFSAYYKCLKILDGFDMVIGFGNYISIPVVLAGKRKGLKTVIHEQNSLVGKANKYLDKKVDLVIGSYQENLEQFNNPNTKILGNPQSSKALNIKKDDSVIKNLGLDPNKKVVVIFMGSLGSESVERKLIEMFKTLDGTYQVIYATGKSHYDEVIKNCQESKDLKIFDQIDGINVMANSDLLVSRAGATTLCEICALGMPAILIPSPYVPNNHQFKNAKSLTDKQAAEMIEEKELTPEKLDKQIKELLFDDERLKTMSENAHKLNNDLVLQDIIKMVEEL